MANIPIVKNREFLALTEEKFLIPDICNIMVETDVLTDADIYVTFVDSPLSELVDTIRKPKITFADNDPSNDTITRENGSWIADGFRAGHEIVIANTGSNDGTYTVDSVSELVLTLDAADTLTDEEVAAGSNIEITGSIPDADWKIEQTVPVETTEIITFEYGPKALRVTRRTGTGDVNLWVRG